MADEVKVLEPDWIVETKVPGRVEESKNQENLAAAVLLGHKKFGDQVGLRVTVAFYQPGDGEMLAPQYRKFIGETIFVRCRNVEAVNRFRVELAKMIRDEFDQVRELGLPEGAVTVVEQEQ